MKLLTPYLMRFIIAATLLTLLFRYSLSYFLMTDQPMWVLLVASVYGLGMFISGLFFGRKEGEYLPIYDIGFRFHLATFVVHNVISCLWLLYGKTSAKENINQLLISAGIWGVFLIMHLIVYLRLRKQSINDLDKNDLFE
jgi:hypothetical protein